MNDFADWINPIVVKELRQGLRSRVFLWALLVIQGVMVCFVCAGVWGEIFSYPNYISHDWFMGVPVAGVYLPLRAFGAVAGELREGTLEPILLTRLTAWKIVVGKWLSLVVECGILLLSCVPYWFLIYLHNGGIGVADLVLFGWATGWSAAFSGALVAISAWHSRLFPRLLMVGCLFVLYSHLLNVAGLRGDDNFWVIPHHFQSFDPGDVSLLTLPWQISGFYVGCWLLSLGIFLLMAFEWGALGMMHQGEGHLWRLRALVLLAILLAFVASKLEPDTMTLSSVACPLLGHGLMNGALVLAIPVCVGSLCCRPVGGGDPVRFLHGRYSWLGRWVGWFFQVSFSSSLLFGSGVLAIYAVWYHNALYHNALLAFWMMAGLGLGWLSLPSLVARLFQGPPLYSFLGATYGFWTVAWMGYFLYEGTAYIKVGALTFPPFFIWYVATACIGPGNEGLYASVAGAKLWCLMVVSALAVGLIVWHWIKERREARQWQHPTVAEMEMEGMI